jgi:hypothetical protein
MRHTPYFQAGILALSLTGCDEFDEMGYFGLRSDDADRLWLVPEETNVGGGPGNLGSIAGNVTEARYALGTQRTAYLLSGNLRTGIGAFFDWNLGVFSGTFQTLAAYDPTSDSIVVEDGVPFMVRDIATGSIWNSFRVYDSGECSLLLDMQDDGLLGLVPALAPTMVDEIDRVFAACERPETERFERIAPVTVAPLLRASPGSSGLAVDEDILRVSTTYRAESIGGCNPVNLDVAFDLGLRSAPSGTLTGVVENIHVDVHGFCIVGGIIEDNVRSRIEEAAPGAFAAAIRDRLLLDPRVLGIDAGQIQSCTQDSQCTSAWPWGSGHRCQIEDDGPGECWVQVDVGRANLRPEGLELILFENDDDPQRALLSDATPNGEFLENLVCGPERWSGVLHPTEDVSGALANASVPINAALVPDTICVD